MSDDIKEHLKSKNRISLALGVVGIVLQASGQGVSPVRLVGTLILVGGLAEYANMKGRHRAFGLLGFLSIIGFLILYFLPPNCRGCGARGSYSDSECAQCGAPLKP